MNKLLSLIVFSLLLFPLASAAADVAYIVKDATGEDSSLISEIQNNGLTLEVLHESNLPSNLSDYRVVVIGDQKLSDVNSIQAHKYRTIIMNSHHFYNSLISGPQLGFSGGKGTSTSPTPLTVIDSGSKISEGLPNNYNAYRTQTTQAKTYFLANQLPSGVRTIVSKSSSFGPVIATADQGTQLLNGLRTENRNVFFGAVNAEFWSDETRLAFSNTLEWVLVGEDRDNDGFFSEDDCNDQDPNSHPGGVEIPYDGIDQDCSGSDLNDLDNDGFVAEEAGGPDCNDQDPQINPSSGILTNNCVNDAPLLGIIDPTLSREGQLVQISLTASDPEQDTLTFSVNDARFIVSDNVISWQTTLDDEGDYTFTATVSDGSLTDSKDFQITLLHSNQPPTSLTIPDITWQEDTVTSINLSEYFSDPDQDPLLFGISSTSDDKNITINSTPQIGVFELFALPNFFGEDWVKFHAFDGGSIEISNRIVLNVTPVNDPVDFQGTIPNQTWLEDTTLEGAFDLSEYFSDPDSSLAFSVSGNSQISVNFQGSLVSLVPNPDFFGSETIVFSATDSEFSAQSNEITLTVIDSGEPPVFSPLTCQTEVEEDSTNNCTLAATDVENNELNFSVVSQENVSCLIQDNLLEYTPNQDFFGSASCVLEVSDIHGSDTRTLVLNVTPVNDPPVFTAFSPNTLSVGILEGTIQTFSVQVSDPENDSLNLSWSLDDSLVSNSSNQYIFNESIGSYNLSAVVSDGQSNNSLSWDVSVGPISDFTCSQVSGNICSETQFCPIDTLGVKDTNSCCSVSCQALPPTFKDAPACTVTNSSLEVDIRRPDPNEEFEIDEHIRVHLSIENDLEDDQDLDVDIHLYDLDEDRSIEDYSTDIEVEDESSRSLTYNLLIPADLQESHRFAIFARAEDDICNQDYVEIDLIRPTRGVRVTKLDVPSKASCGDLVQAKVRVENIGQRDEDASVRLVGSGLRVSERSDTFELEEFGGKDSKTKEFTFQVPQDLEPGKQTLRASVLFSDGESDTISKSIEILECGPQGQDSQEFTLNSDNNLDPQETIVLSPSNQGTVRLSPKTSNAKEAPQAQKEVNALTILVGILSITLLLAASLICLLFYSKRQKYIAAKKWLDETAAAVKGEKAAQKSKDKK